MSQSIYDISCKTIEGEEKSLADYQGRVLLIVNTASKCGFTPQYEALQELYKKYADKGLQVLGFPCNQFMKQEPGDAKEIKEFCSTNYQVEFPLFEKIEVNGQQAHPLYKLLKEKAPGILGSKSIKWNFTKFLVDRKGEVVSRFATNTKPESLDAQIQALLG